MADDSTPNAPPPSKPPAPGGELPPGARVGEYVITGTLAAGGFGAVHAAQHRLLGRRVALKVLHRDLATSAEMVERFVREARVVNRIRHPNIVDIHDFGTLPDGRPYFVMELVEGQSLRTLVERRGRFPPAEALALLRPVCEALEAAHAAGVVHRDIKASNVIVTREGDSPSVKLLDFGIAKLVRPEPGDPGLTQAGQRLGTPHAMAPEQIKGGAIDPRTDVYALGVLLYLLLTHEYPFDATEPQELERQHLEQPPPRPGLRAPLLPPVEAVVLRCLEKQPAARYAGPAALIAALEAALSPPREAAPGAESGERSGVAVLLEVGPSAEAAADPAVLAALGSLLDEAELALGAGGFSLELQTASALLGVRPLDPRPDRARLQRRSAVQLATALAARAAHEPRLQAVLTVHSAPAVLSSTPEGPQVSGGELLDPSSWPPSAPAGTIQATPAALEGGAG